MIPAIAKDLLVPGTIPFLLVGLACGTLLLYRRKDGGRAGRLILTVLLLFYWVFSTPVLAVPIIHALTPSSPPVETVAQAGGATAIVVLGAGMDVYHSRGQMFEASPREDALRILEAARVYRVLDNPWVIATGGFANGRYTEAARMAEELRALDVPADRIVIEGRAQNTHQHAIYVPPLLRERKVSRFVLVTSRQHMARAMRVFRKAGWDPVPSSPEVFADRLQPIEKCLPSKNMLVASQQLFYDAGGMIYYRLRGWI